jgi:hypothetical protein
MPPASPSTPSGEVAAPHILTSCVAACPRFIGPTRLASSLWRRFARAALVTHDDPNNAGRAHTAQMATWIGLLVRRNCRREGEIRSDEPGIGGISAAGLGPHARMQMMQALAEANPAGRPGFLGAHPDPENRIEKTSRKLTPGGLPPRRPGSDHSRNTESEPIGAAHGQRDLAGWNQLVDPNCAWRRSGSRMRGGGGTIPRGHQPPPSPPRRTGHGPGRPAADADLKQRAHPGNATTSYASGKNLRDPTSNGRPHCGRNSPHHGRCGLLTFNGERSLGARCGQGFRPTRVDIPRHDLDRSPPW